MQEFNGDVEIHRPAMLGDEEIGGGFGYRSVAIHTRRGVVEARYYPARGATHAVVFVGGIGGGFDSPARDLYPQLAGDLTEDGVSVLRVRYRLPAELADATHDVLAGLAFLRERGHRQFALVGHSLGGAAVLNAAAVDPSVTAVVAISTQSFGTDRVSALGDRPILLLHGAEDPVLPPGCSLEVYRKAGKGAQLELIPGAGHVLEEVADEVHARVRNWLRDEFYTPRHGSS